MVVGVTLSKSHGCEPNHHGRGRNNDERYLTEKRVLTVRLKSLSQDKDKGLDKDLDRFILRCFSSH